MGLKLPSSQSHISSRQRPTKCCGLSYCPIQLKKVLSNRAGISSMLLPSYSGQSHPAQGPTHTNHFTHSLTRPPPSACSSSGLRPPWWCRARLQPPPGRELCQAAMSALHQVKCLRQPTTKLLASSV